MRAPIHMTACQSSCNLGCLPQPFVFVLMSTLNPCNQTPTQYERKSWHHGWEYAWNWSPHRCCWRFCGSFCGSSRRSWTASWSWPEWVQSFHWIFHSGEEDSISPHMFQCFYLCRLSRSPSWRQARLLCRARHPEKRLRLNHIFISFQT